jgi:L-glyceraldehyde 3-phosphate reductase
MALAWALRDPRMTSLIIGASSVDQLETNIAALGNLELSAEDLGDIDGTVLDL